MSSAAIEGGGTYHFKEGQCHWSPLWLGGSLPACSGVLIVLMCSVGGEGSGWDGCQGRGAVGDSPLPYSEVVPSYQTGVFKIHPFRELQQTGEEIYSKPLQMCGTVWKLKVYPVR